LRNKVREKEDPDVIEVVNFSQAYEEKKSKARKNCTKSKKNIATNSKAIKKNESKQTQQRSSKM
jgi:hypothetical protein